MKIKYPVEKTVTSRSSVRTYEPKPLSPELKEKIIAYSGKLDNPFGVKVSFRLIEKEDTDGKKLGTYGMIKGAQDFIGATVPDTKSAPEALGYSFEKLILYAASLGVGTCWLGGTFKRGEFAGAMDVKENELFPIVSPIGYPTEKRRFAESLVRKVVKADKRFNWGKLFFQEDFSHPLTKEKAGKYAFPLEMVRLGPSASNKQPWRIVRSRGAYHFYEAKTPGYAEPGGFDMQQLDVGIAACHFHLAALEKALPGHFEKLEGIGTGAPENVRYLFSWIKE